MFNRKTIALAVSALVLGASAHASTSFFNNEAAFLAAAAAPLNFESFENATSPSATTVAFAGGTFACAGTGYCPGFFGTWTLGADTGVQSVYFASPDSATFTFNSPITAFGVHIGGAGDVSPNTLTATLGNGDSGLALNNYTGDYSVFGSNNQYFGAISTTAFTTVTFTTSNSGDGIAFDSMSFGVAAVPEPETYAMLLAGLGVMGAVARRRRIKSA